MDNNQFKKISGDMEAIKKLLALMLREQKVKGDVIANAMGITEGRLSQMISPKKSLKTKSQET